MDLGDAYWFNKAAMEDEYMDEAELKDIADAQKPLHVRVAEALGWWRIEPGISSKNRMRPDPCGCWMGVRIGEDGHGWSEHLPHYDTDWAATGPLIEEYAVELLAVDGKYWRAFLDLNFGPVGKGSTPLSAVCNLILVLAEAGKLKG